MARRFTYQVGFACVALALVPLLPACKDKPAPAPAPAPPPTSTSWVQSVHKLDGAPTRVIGARFAPDGASVLVTERRPPKDENSHDPDIFAVSRRPVAGGPAKDIVASDAVVLGVFPLGADIVVHDRPGIPPAKDDDDDDYEDRYQALEAARGKAAVYRISDGGQKVRISPEGRRCSSIVGSDDGQWIAYSLPAEDKKGEDETRVLGAKPGQEITLTTKGSLYDMSPDGSRVLLRRKFPDPDAAPDAGAPLPRDKWLEAMRAWTKSNKGFIIVNVKDQAVSELPASLQVDGKAIDVLSTGFVKFLGDGLLFTLDQGEIYRSALDGSNATRVAGPLPDADGGIPSDAGDAADASAPNDAGSSADAGAPPPRPRRIEGPKGTVFELREEAGSVVLSALGTSEPIAQFEGPLTAFSLVNFDANEKRVVLSILSDTSRDGEFGSMNDDASIFVTEATPGSLSFARAPVVLLSDELQPKLVSASGLPASAVKVKTEHGSLEATVDLPFVEGEKAEALVNRVIAMAKPLLAAIPKIDISLHIRVESLDFRVPAGKDAERKSHVTIYTPGIAVADASVLPLVLRDPVVTSLFTSSNKTLTGALENTGKEPTEPIEAFVRWSSGYGDSRKHQEIKKDLGSIAPGKKVKYSLILADVGYSSSPFPTFRIGGKRVEVLNEYAYTHGLNWLESVLEVRAAHGLWSEHGTQRSYGFYSNPGAFIVKFKPEQVALPDADREALMRKIEKLVRKHRDKFHQGEDFVMKFADPSGGGWQLEDGKKIARYEDEKKKDP